MEESSEHSTISLGERSKMNKNILEAEDDENGLTEKPDSEVNNELNSSNTATSTPRNKSRYGRAHKPKISDDFLMTDRKVGAMFGQSPKRSPNSGNTSATNRNATLSARQKARQIHEALRGTSDSPFTSPDAERRASNNILENTMDQELPNSEKGEFVVKEYVIKPVGQLGCEPPNWEAGDLVWARVYGYPFWPALITLDRELQGFTKLKAIGRVLSQPHLHVQFFKDMGRHSWLPYSSVVPYSSFTFVEANNEELAEIRKNPKMTSAFHVKRSQRAKFISAADEANEMIDMTRKERLETFAKNYPPPQKANHKENSQPLYSKQQKRKLSIQDESRKPVKRIKRENTPDNTSEDTSDTNSSLSTAQDSVKNVPESDKSEESSTENKNAEPSEVKIIAEKKPKIVKKSTKIKSESSTDLGKTDSSEQSVQSSRESTPESGSAGPEIDVVRTGGCLFRGVRRDKACLLCLKSGNAFKCRGICGNYYHPECVAIELSRAQALADGITLEDDRKRGFKKKKKKGRPKKLAIKIKSEPIEKVSPIEESSSDHVDEHSKSDKENEGTSQLSNSRQSTDGTTNITIKKEILENEDTGVETIKFTNLEEATVNGDKNTGLLETCEIKKEKCLNEEVQESTVSSTQDITIGNSVESNLTAVESKKGKGNNTKQSQKSRTITSVNSKVSKTLETNIATSENLEGNGKKKPKAVIGDSNADSNGNEDGDSEKNISEKEAEAMMNFICHECVKGVQPKCFACGGEAEESERQYCSLSQCNKFYHAECLKLWPQAATNGTSRKNKNKGQNGSVNLLCPQHKCHTCVSDDPRNAVGRYTNEIMVRCIRCPTAYHAGDYCLPAGSEVLSATQILCARHYQPLKGGTKIPHFNTAWCFLCSMGGSLICCDLCPTSFHADCLRISPPEGSFICEDCETGRYPLFGEIVWVKLGHYRWWPARILFPSEVPENVNKIPHTYGEFCVKFFGSNDHFWVNRGRVFLYQDGDDVHSSVNKTKTDTTFFKALEEARDALKIYVEMKEARDAKVRPSIKPPSYIRIKTNKPVGNVRLMEGDVSNMTPCDCDPKSENPCGPDSDCLNRILLVECSPLVCRAGDRCGNQCFEKREYPGLQPYLTEDRGWGLKTLTDLKKGQFVIEYVGEMINEEEYRRRIQRKHEEKDENFYFLIIDKDRLLDAGPKGNVARFMNHCCQPNCETQKWTVNGDTRVGLFALQDIPANTELTFNYNLESIGTDRKPCMCRAPNCSGFIGVKANNNKPAEEEQKPRPAKADEKKRNSVRGEKICFSCGDAGDLIVCEHKTCPKAYHKDCVSFSHPVNKKWVCPWHYCNICNKRTIQKCNMCTNSFCIQHAKGRIRPDGKRGYLCPYHDKGSSSKSKTTDKTTASSSGKLNQKSPLNKVIKQTINSEKSTEDLKKNRNLESCVEKQHPVKRQEQQITSSDGSIKSEVEKGSSKSIPHSEVPTSSAIGVSGKTTQSLSGVNNVDTKNALSSSNKKVGTKKTSFNNNERNQKETRQTSTEPSGDETEVSSDSDAKKNPTKSVLEQNKRSDSLANTPNVKDPGLSNVSQKSPIQQHSVPRRRGRPRRTITGEGPLDKFVLKSKIASDSNQLNASESAVEPGVSLSTMCGANLETKETIKEKQSPSSLKTIDSINKSLRLKETFSGQRADDKRQHTVENGEAHLSDKVSGTGSTAHQNKSHTKKKLPGSGAVRSPSFADENESVELVNPPSDNIKTSSNAKTNTAKKNGIRVNVNDVCPDKCDEHPSKKRGRVPNRFYDDFEDVPVQKTPKLRRPLQGATRFQRKLSSPVFERKSSSPVEHRRRWSKEVDFKSRKGAKIEENHLGGNMETDISQQASVLRSSLENKSVVDKVDRNCISPLLLPVHG